VPIPFSHQLLFLYLAALFSFCPPHFLMSHYLDLLQFDLHFHHLNNLNM
jgi:hypothetical protein